MTKLLSIRLIELLVSCYDIITWPIYYMIQRPKLKRENSTRVRAKQVEPYVWENLDKNLEKSNRTTVDTLDKLFRDSVRTYASRNCLGVRKVLALEYKDSTAANGVALANGQAKVGKTNNNKSSDNNGANNKRVISKYILADEYSWYTYKQIEDKVVSLSSGLINLCNESLINSDNSRKLLICADTCMNWFLMAHACFRNNITVVTAYTTLSDDSILHIIQETEVKILVVSQKMAPRLPKLVRQAPQVDTVILLDEPLPGEHDELANLKGSLLTGDGAIKRIVSYEGVAARGKTVLESEKERVLDEPATDDIAVLMYTSGSTGTAKGVMLSHNSIVYTALSFSGPGDINHEDRYIGYLPLGHVLELAAECIFLRNGSTIAYSSALTLTSNSPMIKAGQKGDAMIFRPTIMGAVPLVLDRIKSGLQSAIKKRGHFYDQLINDFVIRYKRYWWERYYDTPIMNLLICRQFNMLLGGKIRAICSGGAALSKETQEYLRHVSNYTVLQGYGLTETSAAASFCDIEDRRYNVVGPPYPIVRLKLESWSDYSVEDKPYPRGEVIIGGQPVAAGYYKMEKETAESFYVDPKSGFRFFRTGDIGLMLPDGCLKIIDRKKDIVKPLSGEYISLSEVEVALRTCALVENICVYCSQFSNYVVAIIKPDLHELREFACELLADASEQAADFRKQVEKSTGIVFLLPEGDSSSAQAKESYKRRLKTMRLEELYSNEWLQERVLKNLQTVGLSNNLKRTHIPSRIKLVTEDWSPESGLTTASFKLRRREVEKYYANDIRQMYLDLGQNIEQ